MKASRLIELLKHAIQQHGDLEIVVAYDSAHCEISEESDYGDDGFGPRQLVAVHRDSPNTPWDAKEVQLGEKVFQL